MYNLTPFLSAIFFLSLIFVNGHCRSVANAKAKGGKSIYIVYLGGKPHDDHKRIKESHYDLLASVVGGHEEARKAMVYSYRYGFSGFSAVMTASQAKKVAGLPGVVSVTPDKHHRVQTSRSWDFLGLTESAGVPGELQRKANRGDGMIVGVIDSGVFVREMPSFGDEGFGPVPKRWKGICRSMSQFNATFQCNRKVIGGRWFFKGAAQTPNVNLTEFLKADDLSPLDVTGHGSQVASIIAGSHVQNFTFASGLDMGGPRGGAPAARIASYKACWHLDLKNFSCSGADLLSAFDYAIHDGVDVISVSVGIPVPLPSETADDTGIGIGAFHAMTFGIPVIAAAGNDGPSAFTVTNVEPWLITVAASTIDRIFAYSITLGNGEKFIVDSYFPRGSGLVPLVFGGSYSNEIDLMEMGFDPAEVKGKLVLVFGSILDKTLDLALKVYEAGAVGIIYSNPPSVDALPIFEDGIMPYAQVGFDVGTRIKEYIFKTEIPTAQLGAPTVQTGKAITPKITDFSSRGPSSIAPAILKPDIAAPGDKILCADPLKPEGFRISSGTSHATPHVSAIVALLRVLHPEWSPSAIKSALITTAWNSDSNASPIFAQGSSRRMADPFDYGGGIVNPAAVDDPGLVYDMRAVDYAQYLCSLGYNNSIIFKTLSRNLNATEEEKQTICPKTRPSLLDLNMPSMVIPDLFKPVTLRRTVTNVGPVNSVYKAIIQSPVGAFVTVKPRVLRFDANVKKRNFKMMVSADKLVNSAFTFGSLTWTDGVHNVRTPIAVRKQVVPISF